MAPQRPEDGFIRIPEHEFEAILARDATEDAWCWPNFRPATLLVFARPGFHVAQGGGFEMRAVLAMALRGTFLGDIALLARQTLSGR